MDEKLRKRALEFLVQLADKFCERDGFRAALIAAGLKQAGGL